LGKLGKSKNVASLYEKLKHTDFYIVKNMDQLFKALPRDLQWEVLTEFTGTHTVRKGKLMRKLVVDNRHQLIEGMSRIQQVAKYYNPDGVHTTSVVKLKSGRTIAFSQDSQSGCINYDYYKPSYDYGTLPGPSTGCAYVYTPEESPVALPPYVFNVYPSYPYTNKKYNKW